MCWTERETTVYNLEDLPFDDDGKLSLIDPSRIRVCIPGFVYPVDIGSWCFEKRKKLYFDTSTERCSIYLVEMNSFRKERIWLVTRFLDYIYSHLKSGKSRRSLLTCVGQFKMFVDWCDENYPEAFLSKNLIRDAVDNFSQNLLYRVKVEDISINTACAMQLVARSALEWMYEDTRGEIFDGVRRIKRSYAATKVTEPPADDKAAEALSLYVNIFEQVGKFVTKFEKYPAVLKLPQGDFWYFPSAIPFMSRSRQSRFKKDNKRYKAYNYEEGKVRSVEELVKIIKRGRKGSLTKAAKLIRKDALDNIDRANENRIHPRRVLLATLAQQSFMMMFSANTGMSLGQIAALSWKGEEFKIESEKQGFKTIKGRAHGVEVSFMISSSFVAPFKRLEYSHLNEMI